MSPVWRLYDRMFVGSAVALILTTGLALAEDAAGGPVPPGWHVRHVRTIGAAARTPARAALGERSLTVRRAPTDPDDLGPDVYDSGGTVYNDIRAFAPEPTTDSGVQFPYGLDGVGGFGSQFGFAADSDTATYDRGALSVQARTLGLR